MRVAFFARAQLAALVRSGPRAIYGMEKRDIAGSLVLGQLGLALLGTGSLISFACGAATSAFTVNWARRRSLRSVYALPLVWEGILLLIFSFISWQVN